MYFAFNEGRGQLALDFSGRKLDGTLGLTTAQEAMDPVWVADGKLGSALSFNGTDSCVRVPDAPELNFADGVTLMAWVKRTGSIAPAGVNGMIVSRHFTHFSRSWDLHLDATENRFHMYVFEDSTNAAHVITSPVNIVAQLDTWYHVAGTYDRTSGTATLYVDGVPVASAAIGSFALQQASVPVRVGCYNDSSSGDVSRAFFTGVIDEVMVFNRALSADRIKAYHEAGQ